MKLSVYAFFGLCPLQKWITANLCIFRTLSTAEMNSRYKGGDLLSTGQLFQFFQDGFDYTSTSGLRFSTVSGSLRLQFRLLASGPRFEKISALRAASSLYESLYNCISLYKKPYKKFPRCARPFPFTKVCMTAVPFIKGLINNFRVASGHFSL